MDLFIQLVVAGLAAGGIYASVALALVMIHEATELINFAQGEMAMFSTYIAWTMINAGFPYWAAFFLTVGISFVGGVVIERVIIRPFERAAIFTLIVVFIALLLIFNGLAGWIWTYTIKSFESPFSDAPLVLMEGVSVRMHDVGAIGVTLVVLLLLYLFFRFTPIGLAMRAAAQNPTSSKLVGIRVGWMLALGWGLAAAIGAVAGMMVAPIVFLDPSMMAGILLYGFASALLGGINNPGGAVAGGFIVGVFENLIGAYMPFIGNELKLTVALAIIIVVVIFRPGGLFGKVVVSRV
jgi:branched-chain amino acid transport system permease protein